ncbi:unnamed protein product [Moneuplotes crassus]|uniref:Nose resistant-to-fluoxetine protein N-terminal domain-containing protein n=1 Tax=Euplotes crassus TaxID=5936 RepID=A0AAD1YAX6_EUPCR|nr:unnamed protein product [Moneuplotes crassus]
MIPDTKRIWAFLCLLACCVLLVRSQASGEVNPFTVYTQTYGRDVELDPYSFNLQTFLAYPHLFGGTTRRCQMQLNEYNYYLLQSSQDSGRGTPLSAKTINAVDQLSDFVHLSSNNENEFSGYERCRDQMRQRYYIVHREDRPNILHFGMCVPDLCTPDDIHHIITGLRRLLATYRTQNVNLGSISPGVLALLEPNFKLRVYDSDVMNEDAKDIEFGHICMWSFFGIFTLLVIAATAYHINIEVSGDAQLNYNLGVQGPRNFKERLVLGFSLGKAFEKLTDTTSRLGANTLEPLRGYKFFCALWIAAGLYCYGPQGPFKDAQKLNDELSKDFITILGRATIFMVDCLLWISGVYTAYAFIYDQVIVRDYQTQTPRDKIVIYIIEVLNKTGKLFFLVLASILIFGWVGPTIGNGPVFSEMYYYHTRRMNDYWYTYLTFTNNFIKVENQGMVWGSFIATELQLFICALPLIRMLIRRRTAGLAILAFLMVCSLVCSCIAKDVHVSVIRDAYPVMEYQQRFYQKAFPYCAGILTGLFTWKVHHEENEGTKFQEYVEKIEQNSTLRYIMHFSGTAMIIAVICTLQPIDHDRSHDITTSSIFLLTASQIFMPLGMALNFIPMVLNRSGALKSIMGSRLFKPHSTLLFIMIPISGTLAFWAIYTQQEPYYYDFKTYVYTMLSYFLLLSILALLVWCLVISPIYNTFDCSLDYLKNYYNLGGDFRDNDEPDENDKLLTISEDELNDDDSHKDDDDKGNPGPSASQSFSHSVDE